MFLPAVYSKYLNSKVYSKASKSRKELTSANGL